MEARSGRIVFPPHVGSSTLPLNVIFDRRVLTVAVALAGYEAHYTGNDHHVRQVTADLTASLGARVDDGWEVRLVATLCLRDDSGAAFEGWIDYLFFVELAKPDLRPGELHPPLGSGVLEG